MLLFYLEILIKLYHISKRLSIVSQENIEDTGLNPHHHKIGKFQARQEPIAIFANIPKSMRNIHFLEYFNQIFHFLSSS